MIGAEIDGDDWRYVIEMKGMNVKEMVYESNNGELAMMVGWLEGDEERWRTAIGPVIVCMQWHDMMTWHDTHAESVCVSSDQVND
jgi:hypothetical protein